MPSALESTTDCEVKKFFRNIALGSSIVAALSWWLGGHGAAFVAEGRLTWTWQLLAAMVAICVAVTAYVSRRTVEPLYRGLQGIARRAGAAGTVLLLAIVYYGIFTPVAAWFRLTRRDALRRSWRPDADTYFEPLTRRVPKRRYLRQF